MNLSRRKLLKGAAALAGLPTMLVAQSPGGGGEPKDRPITVGGIGLGPRGREVLAAFLRNDDVRFVAIADVQKSRREIVRKTVDRHYGNNGCAAYRDMREILERKDIEAVIIATGDRWHAPASILAARAGKDVYCEKPCSMNIGESREVDEAVLHHGRVYQAGTQRRNVDNFRFAVDLARSGKLGKLHTLHAGILAPEDFLPPLPGQPDPDPEEIDWDRWLGPAGARPYNKRYAEGQWRGHGDGLSCGYKILEWGCHTVDLCQWAADADGSAPVEYEPDGGTIHARYANGIRLVMRLAGFANEGNWMGLGTCPVRFEGDLGWVEAGDHGKLGVSDPKLLAGGVPDAMPGTDPRKHVRDFLDCVKTRRKPACHSTVARSSHVASHAAAVAWKLGRKLRFDPVAESFIDDPEANGMRTRARRAPWGLGTPS